MLFHFGLTGFPLSHSLSPQLHNAALRACGLEGSYSLFPIQTEDERGLAELLIQVRKGGIAGLNVTIPYKQTLIPFLDQLSPTAKAIGAVNTVTLQNGRLVGDNTDVPGFTSDLKKFLAPQTGNRDLKALVLGAGGSARAVVYALMNDGWQVTIASRRIEPARQAAVSLTEALEASPGDQIQITDFTLSRIDLSDLSLIVNTTPIGMAPDVERSPWPQNIPFPPRAGIYDLVYNPRETRLVRDACSQGLPAVTGLGMLVEQAALSFEIWTGHRPPREAMLAAVSQTAY